VSGIGGLFYRDRRSADTAALRASLAAVPERGVDGTQVWASGSVALGHQWLRLTPHDSGEQRWFVDAQRQLAVTLDGRIDNRTALTPHWRCHLARPDRISSPSDAEIVLAAYLEWGDACAQHLLGDFAFAIWDGRRQLVYCARDVSGVQPLYYALDRRRFVWASDQRQVLSAGVSRAPNEGMIAEYLAGAIQSRTETLYREVQRLPAAHWMTVTVDQVRIEPYWQADRQGELSLRSDEEYAEAFLALFQESVTCRAPHGTRVGAYLSGGLDSSSVVSLLCALGRDVESFSLVFPDTPDADERAYIDAVVSRWGLMAHRIDGGVVDGVQALARARRRADILDLPSDLLGERLLAHMEGRGIRVALTGAGGDYGLSGSFYHYADLLRARDWSGFVTQLRADRQMPDGGWSPRHLFDYGLRPLLPPGVRAAARLIRNSLPGSGGVPDWIGAGLATRTRLGERLRPPASRATGVCSRRFVCEVFESGWTAWVLEQSARAAAESLVELRHPFLDRRLVELTIALPEWQRWRGRETKVVLRRALAPFLPDSVYARSDKADFSPCVVEAIERVGGAQVLDHLQIASIGWVDQARVRAMYQALRCAVTRQQGRGYEGMFPLWLVLGIEHWYRATYGKGHRDESERSDKWDQTERRPAVLSAKPTAVRAAGAR